jgi:hypothetical protein
MLLQILNFKKIRSIHVQPPYQPPPLPEALHLTQGQIVRGMAVQPWVYHFFDTERGAREEGLGIGFPHRPILTPPV